MPKPARKPDSGETPRLGFCCKFIPDEPPGTHATQKAAKEAALAMNLTSATMAYLTKLEPVARAAKLSGIVTHNLTALQRQIDWVGARPPLERLLRIASNVLPGYTHPIAEPLYADPTFARAIETELARIGERARALGVRLSFHPGPFCLLASRNPAAIANGLGELEYHARIFEMMGFGSGWHPHGTHINLHVGARDPGLAGFRATLPRASETARNLLTIENDDFGFSTDELLELADVVPIVLDLHHHWVLSGGEYLEPDDPRIGRIQESWRGVRPIAHISVSREDMLPAHDPDVLPDFAALRAAGVPVRELAAHSDMMWNRAVNALVARHLAWADFEVEAKSKNLASVGLADQVRAGLGPTGTQRGLIAAE